MILRNICFSSQYSLSHACQQYSHTFCNIKKSSASKLPLSCGLRTSFHHPVIARDQKCTCTEPCQWTGNTDSRIAKDSCHSNSSNDSHHQLDHTGCERSPAVLHALDGSAVYGKQTKNEIKWCHNCEIHIGIMIYFLCRIRKKHPHDRMAKDENSHTHEQVKSFCLNQAGAYSLTDSFLLSRPQNSAPHNWKLQSS